VANASQALGPVPAQDVPAQRQEQTSVGRAQEIPDVVAFQGADAIIRDAVVLAEPHVEGRQEVKEW
jgi:hypothetical protein